MKHAFLVIAHNNWNQLSRFLTAIDSYKCDFFIHVNSKVSFSQEVREQINLACKKSQIYFTKRVPITWGDYGICKASLECLEMAKGVGGYDYYHLITGSDLLLTDIESFDQFFESNQYKNQNQKSKTNYINVGIPNEKFSSRVKYYNFFIPLWRNKNFLIRKLGTSLSTLLGYAQKSVGIDRWKKTNLELYHGSSWWSITDEFATYVLERTNWIEEQFREKTFAADEFVFQVLIMNSTLRETRYLPTNGRSPNLRLLDFERGNQYGSPYIWHIYDKTEIQNSKNLIGRKFDETVDGEIVDFVIEKINMDTVEE